MRGLGKFIFIIILAFYTGTTLFGKTGKLIDGLPNTFQIIPYPQKTELLDGDGLKAGQLKTLIIAGEFSRPVMSPILSRLPESNKGNKGTLILKLDSTESIPKSEEGYVLTVLNGGAEIVSRGEAGLFYGCQTLEQLLEDASNFDTPIPACEITDFPAMAYRAVHFDVKHHLDHMNYYYESIDRLARYKINAVIFEFEDKLRYQREALVGAPQAISIGEMAALTQYARDRHIGISPLVQGLGHATYILKHEEYAHLREIPSNRWAFCPLNEETYKVLFNLYLDAMEATPGSKYFHIGGDEIGNIGLCERCKPTGDKDGLLALNLYWLNRVCNFITDHGRIPIFWDDMPLKYADVHKTCRTKSTMNYNDAKAAWDTGSVILKNIINQFPKECIYMRWNYSMGTQPGNIMALDWYKKNGLKTMVSTAAQSGSAMLFPFDDREGKITSKGVPAIKSFIELGVQKGVEGMLCTAWEDCSPHFETFWRGYITSAEHSWSLKNRSLNEFDNAWLQREFAASVSDFGIIYKKLRKAALFWDKAFNKGGSREDDKNAMLNLPGVRHSKLPGEAEKQRKTDFSDISIELPDIQDPGKWSKKYAEKLNTAEEVIKDYKETSTSLNQLYLDSKRNRYHWEVYSAVNDFQITAPRLLLALKKSDSADETQHKAGFEEVEDALKEFDKAWINLKEVYGKTRFISHPDNYVPDRYYHFASQREDLSWMIQVEEVFHQKVRDYLIKKK